MFSTMTRMPSAKAMVLRQKYAPRSRKVGSPMITPTMAASTPPTSMPIQGETPYWRVRMVEV